MQQCIFQFDTLCVYMPIALVFKPKEFKKNEGITVAFKGYLHNRLLLSPAERKKVSIFLEWRGGIEVVSFFVLACQPLKST